MQTELRQLYLHAKLACVIWNLLIGGEQRQSPLLLMALVEGFYRLQPSLALAVVDLAQIQHVSIDDSPARKAPLLRNAPVAVLFAVLESSMTLQVHRPRA